MITSADLIHLDYPPDLTEAGIRHTCCWLAESAPHPGNLPVSSLHRKIAQVAAELAFRRLLHTRQVAFKSMGLEPFTHLRQFDLSVGGHRLHLDTTLLSRQDQISSLGKNPGELLQACALIPADALFQAGQSSQDIFVFAFLLAQKSTNLDARDKTEMEGRSHYYLAILPECWSRPDTWIPLEPLILKSEAAYEASIELGGQNAERLFINESIQLQPQLGTRVSRDFFSLSTIHLQDVPDSCIGIHSPRHKRSQRTHTIQSNEWGDLWVHGTDIWMTGWLTLGEFRQRSFILPAGQPTYQYARTHVKNLCVPMNELHPLEALFMQAGKGSGT
jgi:hypothetical protein